MTINKNDVVQLSPNVANAMFACCMMTVSDVCTWGVVGYVQPLGKDGKIGGHAYYRAPHGEYVWVGKARWVIDG